MPQTCQCITPQIISDDIAGAVFLWNPYSLTCITPQIISDDIAGETLCRKCGIILESHTAGYAESNEKNAASRHGYGIGTGPPRIRLSHRLSHKIAQRETGRDKRTKELFMALKPILEKIAAADAMAKESYRIARECIKHDMVKGRRKTDVAAVCVMVSCKVRGRSMPESEIVKIANSSKRTTRKACRMILQNFDVNTADIHQRTMTLIGRICSDLYFLTKFYDPLI